MNKSKAIAIIHKSHGKNRLSSQNTHWANVSIYGSKEGWWLNVPFEKFSKELFFILNNEKSGQFLFVHIPQNSIKQPRSIFRHKGKTADIFISTVNTGYLSENIPLIDTQSNSSEHDFSTYRVELFVYESSQPSDENLFPDEIPNTLKEGSKKTVTVNSYERNTQARNECIKKYGVSCVVCGFDFESTYGKRGADFIHVHHLVAISDIGEEYVIDPLNDLRPVCPNCHSMLHRKDNISIEELKSEIKSNKAN